MVRTRASRRGRQRSPSPSSTSDEPSLSAETQAMLKIITDKFQAQIETLVSKVDKLTTTPPPPTKTSTQSSDGGEDVSDTVSQVDRDKSQDQASDIQVIKSTQPSSSSHHFFGKPNIARFSGKDPTLHIDSWLRFFDVVMHDKSEEIKKFEVAKFLDGDALTWYANHIIPGLELITWIKVKEDLIERFKVHELRPFVAAQDRYLLKGENVQKYFDDKMRLLQQTNLLDADKVALLSRGMPHYYKALLICADIKSPSKWLTTTLELEASFKRSQQFKRPSPPTSDFKTMTATNDKKPKKSDKKPNACRICIKRGIPDQMHWHSDCPHRDPNWQARKTEETNTAHSLN